MPPNVEELDACTDAEPVTTAQVRITEPEGCVDHIAATLVRGDQSAVA